MDAAGQFGTVSQVATFLEANANNDPKAVSTCAPFGPKAFAVAVTVAQATAIGKTLLAVPAWPYNRTTTLSDLARYQPDESMVICVLSWNDPEYPMFTHTLEVFFPNKTGGALGMGAYGPKLG